MRFSFEFGWFEVIFEGFGDFRLVGENYVFLLVFLDNVFIDIF